MATKKRDYPDRLKRLDNRYKDPNRGVKKTEIRPKIMLLPDQYKKYSLHKDKLKLIRNKGVSQLTETEILRRCLLRLSDKSFLESLDFKIDNIKY